MTEREQVVARLLALLEGLTDDEIALTWREGHSGIFDAVYGRRFKAVITVWTP